MADVQSTSAQSFTDRDAALQAAQGHYPLDVLLEQNGRQDRSTSYADSEAHLKVLLTERKYQDGQKIYLWLPHKA